MKYTNHNNELTLKDIGKTVKLKGWVSKSRNLGGMIFVDLRDQFGITQLIIKENSLDAHKLRSEYVIEVAGKVVQRENPNLTIKTGEIEVLVSYLVVLNTAETTPIVISDDTDALEETRLKYRYLDLRRPIMNNYLVKRHEITHSVRNFLSNNGFIELETPLLGRSTPEGARDYLVPSRLYGGEFYALPQSPQQYKQLLMIAGFEKYFQIAKCFRDEDLRADRQPEFTQIDIEMSFIDEQDIMSLSEKLMKKVFSDVLDIKITTPFKQMTFDHAVSYYGVDKPDTRFELLLNDYTSLLSKLSIPLFENTTKIMGIKIPNDLSITRKIIDKYAQNVKIFGETLAFLRRSNNEITGSISKFIDIKIADKIGLTNDSIIFLVAGSTNKVNESLGQLRNHLGRDLHLIDPDLYNFLWITDWPLLEFNDTDNRFYAAHHPFTAPRSVVDLEKNPKQSIAKAYDMVLNGYELGGGSIRIHEMKTQELMFKTLGFSSADIKSQFGYFVDALKYGTPPHGGIAFGMDRLVMLMTKTNNIKDVIAFPKTQNARDIMTHAPSAVDKKQLDELSLLIKEKHEKNIE